MILDQRTGSSSRPLAYSLLHTKVTRGGCDPAPQTPITPSQMAASVCGLTAASCPYWCEHRQSCPGVTKAVSYEPCFLHSTRRRSRLAGRHTRFWRLPFSTQIPDPAVSHTFVQPNDCLIPDPPSGDANWVSRTSGWREGVTAPPLAFLELGPARRSERLHNCNLLPYTASRPKIWPCLHSETRRKSSAGLEPPPLVPLLRVGPLTTPYQLATSGFAHRQQPPVTTEFLCMLVLHSHHPTCSRRNVSIRPGRHSRQT